MSGEIEIGQTVAIDIRGAHSISVVVVNQLVGFASVVYNAVLERYAAGLPLIREPEVVNYTRARGQLGFLASALGQPRGRRGSGRRRFSARRAAARSKQR